MKFEKFIQLAVNEKYDQMEQIFPITDRLLKKAVKSYCKDKDYLNDDEVLELLSIEANYERFEMFGGYDRPEEIKTYFTTIRQWVLDLLDDLIDVLIEQQYETAKMGCPESTFVFIDGYLETL